jgi:hypothetical protein
MSSTLSARRVKFCAGCTEGFQVYLKHEKAIHSGGKAPLVRPVKISDSDDAGGSPPALSLEDL